MDKKIITLAEAKALGLKRYFTGKPCKHGHVTERITVSRVCVECFKAYFVVRRATDPEYCEREADRKSTPEYRERDRTFHANPEYRERDKYRRSLPDSRERQRSSEAKSKAKSKAKYELLMAELNAENIGETE